MNMMTNLSANGLLSEGGGWLPIVIAVVVVLLVLVVCRLIAANRKNADTAPNATDVVSSTSSSVAPANASEDDAMMAAMIGAIKANEEQGAILAAITAAIAVVWESEHPGTGFRVVSYRHVEKRSPWNAR